MKYLLLSVCVGVSLLVCTVGLMIRNAGNKALEPE